jgi:pimeloyl-ACP methyl ester carboxylesterase
LKAEIRFVLQCIAAALNPFLPEHAKLYHPIRVGAWRWLSAVWKTLVWLALIAQAFFVRYFLIEYVGDVAAYISPFKDSKFDAIRTEIQAIGLKVGRAIYGFTGVPGVPEYSRVIVVGHSLGSVLAYYTLNALINTDLVTEAAARRRVQERTSHLITFGSPLDKTAFLFRNQSNHPKDPLREQLAAGFQPLIQDYKYRRDLTWINLWSPKDVISGELNYYDDPGIAPTDPRQVDNLADPAGRTWFKAHVQYWAGELLADTLYGAVCNR